MQNWEYIPKNAFLYFPRNEQIKVGTKHKTWRKIFESNDHYDDFENEHLEKLEKEIQSQNVFVHQWFDQPNRLRYLQANKFDVKKTCRSIAQNSKWRSTGFPVTLNDKHLKILTSGAVQIIGRDNCYRPIILLRMSKFDTSQTNLVPVILVQVMEFVINQLLIEGQVQNYILIVDLEGVSIGIRNLESIFTDSSNSVIQFTTNCYRSRLYRCYMLSSPTFLVWGWKSIISRFVCESTFHKILISSQSTHNQLWTHIHRDIMFKQHGGNRKQTNVYLWPPKIQDLKYEAASHPSLISEQKYYELYRSTKLKGRKISQTLIFQKQKQKRSRQSTMSYSQLNCEQNGIDIESVQQQERNFKPKVLQTFFRTSTYRIITIRK